jgi:hypothetical protein
MLTEEQPAEVCYFYKQRADRKYNSWEQFKPSKRVRDVPEPTPPPKPRSESVDYWEGELRNINLSNRS